MKRHALLIISMLCFAVALVSAFLIPAFAADGAAAVGTPLGESISGVLSGTVFPLINALLAGLIGWAVVHIGNKYKIDALINSEALIQSAAYKGVSMAEEFAARKMKTMNIKIASSQKLNMAIAQVLNAAPKLTQEEAAGYVESALAKITGVGATGEKAV